MSNEAEAYGVTIEHPTLDPARSYYEAAVVRHLPQDQNNGNHNVYVDLFDEGGRDLREPRVYLEARNINGVKLRVYLDKPYGEPGGNFVLFRDDTYCLFAPNAQSDIVDGLHTRHPDEPPGNTLYHHSFYVQFVYHAPGAVPGGNGSGQPTLAELRKEGNKITIIVVLADAESGKE